MTEKKKQSKITWVLLLIFSMSLTYLWWMAIKFHQDYQRIPAHHLIGNKHSTVAALKEKGFPFSFLVIGDTRASEIAEVLIEMALEKGGSSFMVMLGDFVRKPDIWNHRFFLTEMIAEIKPTFPVFLVAGNHDIDFTLKIKVQSHRVTPEIYESLYGERNFDFVFNNCLFIICGFDRTKPTTYLNYLREVLSKRAGGKRHIFVFLHMPPKGLGEHIPGPLPKGEELFSILQDYKRVTCFFGDYHGHWRGQFKGVDVIVSGGGGGRLKRSSWGEFHHILRITVDRDKLSEEVITIQGEIGLEDRFEERVFTILFPTIQNCAWILYPIFVLLLIMSGYIFIKFIKTVRHS